mgnify:CR=1 FL=1
MSIPMNHSCVECFLLKRLAFLRQHGTPEQATAGIKKIFAAIADAPEDMDSAWLGAEVDAQMCDDLGISRDFMQAEKALSNQYVLSRLDTVRSRIAQAPDRVFRALQFAVLGNYIDFSALHGQVSFAVLDEMLDKVAEIVFGESDYESFCRDLQHGGSLLYITDNAGEIGFDRLLAEEIASAYPQVDITFCVRGDVVSNDATRADAEAVGIPFPVIDSGCAIGGTVEKLLSPEAKTALENARIILAKGMGNTESLYGCGHNVYYAFLVKCPRLMEFFNKEKMTPMFIREGNYG